MNNSLHDELEVLFEESAALANRLKKNARLLHRNDNLSAIGRSILQTLHRHGSMTVPQLAEARSSTRQNIQALTQRLAEAGYIEFVSNPQHKRSVLVTMTESGRDILASANEREATVLENLLPPTATAQLREATELLRKLRVQLGGESKSRRAKNTSPTATTSTTARVPATRPAASPIEDELPVSLL